MELRAGLLLSLCVGCMAVTIKESIDTGDDGGGSGEGQIELDTEAGLTDDVVEGSGDELEDQPNIRCDSLYCWCEYKDGTPVPNTRSYVQRIDCSPFLNKLPSVAPSTRPKTTTTPSITVTEPTLPSRTKPVAQPHNVIVTSDKQPSDDITYEEPLKSLSETENSGNENSITYNNKDDVIPFKSDDKDTRPIDIDNSIPKYGEKPEQVDEIDESQEEKTNEISGARYKAAASQDLSVKKEMTIHSGILAALIGGGVVLLLCVVLVILFIVYRVRKKDEGSYPLSDEKPSKNYAYAKAPSREFFA